METDKSNGVGLWRACRQQVQLTHSGVVSNPGSLAQRLSIPSNRLREPLQREEIRWTDSRKRQRSLNKVRFTMMR